MGTYRFRDTEKASATVEAKVNVYDTVATASLDRAFLAGKAKLEALLNAAMKAAMELDRMNNDSRKGLAPGCYESEQRADISHDLFCISLGIDELIGDAGRLDEPEARAC